MSAHIDPVSSVIFWFTCLLCAGILGRFLAIRFNYPKVLGELVMGIVLGNVLYALDVPISLVLREGVTSLNNTLLTESNKVAYTLDHLSRIGIIFLLFMVGLETSLSELKQTGRDAIWVAIIGVVLPILLGLGAMKLFLPNASMQTDLFVAATLSATSVGITARVLKEMNKLRSREAKTILGAAMLDDVLGLIILSMVSSLVIEDTIHAFIIVKILTGVILFFLVALWMGPWILRQAVKYCAFLSYWEAKLFIAFIFLMALSWGAALAGLSTIIGAFAAGMILNDGFFEHHHAAQAEYAEKKVSLHSLMAPFEALLAPLFFVLMGMQVKLETFISWKIGLIAAGLLLVAVLGKLLAGFGARRPSNRLFIGIGMLPRGEVGLIFASVGRTLGVMSDEVFTAIVVVIMLTTLMAPPWLKLYSAKRTYNE